MSRLLLSWGFPDALSADDHHPDFAERHERRNKESKGNRKGINSHWHFGQDEDFAVVAHWRYGVYDD
jgi:hypothetical protein